MLRVTVASLALAGLASADPNVNISIPIEEHYSVVKEIPLKLTSQDNAKGISMTDRIFLNAGDDCDEFAALPMYLKPRTRGIMGLKFTPFQDGEATIEAKGFGLMATDLVKFVNVTDCNAPPQGPVLSLSASYFDQYSGHELASVGTAKHVDGNVVACASYNNGTAWHPIADAAFPRIELGAPSHEPEDAEPGALFQVRNSGYDGNAEFRFSGAWVTGDDMFALKNATLPCDGSGPYLVNPASVSYMGDYVSVSAPVPVDTTPNYEARVCYFLDTRLEWIDSGIFKPKREVTEAVAVNLQHLHRTGRVVVKGRGLKSTDEVKIVARGDDCTNGLDVVMESTSGQTLVVPTGDESRATQMQTQDFSISQVGDMDICVKSDTPNFVLMGQFTVQPPQVMHAEVQNNGDNHRPVQGYETVLKFSGQGLDNTDVFVMNNTEACDVGTAHSTHTLGVTNGGQDGVVTIAFPNAGSYRICLDFMLSETDPLFDAMVVHIDPPSSNNVEDAYLVPPTDGKPNTIGMTNQLNIVAHLSAARYRVIPGTSDCSLEGDGQAADPQVTSVGVGLLSLTLPNTMYGDLNICLAPGVAEPFEFIKQVHIDPPMLEMVEFRDVRLPSFGQTPTGSPRIVAYGQGLSADDSIKFVPLGGDCASAGIPGFDSLSATYHGNGKVTFYLSPSQVSNLDGVMYDVCYRFGVVAGAGASFISIVPKSSPQVKRGPQYFYTHHQGPVVGGVNTDITFVGGGFANGDTVKVVNYDESCDEAPGLFGIQPVMNSTTNGEVKVPVNFPVSTAGLMYKVCYASAGGPYHKVRNEAANDDSVSSMMLPYVFDYTKETINLGEHGAVFPDQELAVCGIPYNGPPVKIRDFEIYHGYDGMGTLPHHNGQYHGGMKGGLKHGPGKISFNNGDVFEGEFVNGLREGHGTFKYHSGKLLEYAGDYNNNRRNGHGELVFRNGNKFVGNFVNGKREGHGEFLFANGNKLVGEFKDGKRFGVGQFIKATGEIQNVNWGQENKPAPKPGMEGGAPSMTTYLGCVVDGPVRDLPYHGMTFTAAQHADPTFDYVEACAAKCRDEDFVFMGIQAKHDCWCGDDYGRVEIAGAPADNPLFAPAHECDRICGPNHSICGGMWRNSVYRVGEDIEELPM